MRRDPELPMREIRRCPACLTYVYTDARRCHGCGERVGRRRLLTRGSWIFIVLAAAGFAIGRGIDIQQNKRDRLARALAETARSDLVSSFVGSWIEGNQPSVDSDTPEQPEFRAGLDRLRAKFPTVLPGSDFQILELDRSGGTRHAQRTPEAPVKHEGERQAGLRASAAPTRSFVRFWPPRPRDWSLETWRFRAKVSKATTSYVVEGSVCIEDNLVACLQIDKVEGPGGEVKPVE